MKKTFILLILSTLFSHLLNGQLWEHYYPLSNYRYGQSIVQTYDGGYLILALNGNPYSNGLVYKVDSDGNVLWIKTIANSTDVFRPLSICKAHNQGYLISGYSLKYDPWAAACVLKFNECFEKQWINEYGIFNNTEYITKILPIGNQGFIAAALYFGLGSPLDSGRVGLLKINNSGDSLWYGDYTHSQGAELQNIIKLKDDAILITGRTFSPFSGSSVIKVDSSGNELWFKNFSINGMNSFSDEAIETTDSGFLFINFAGISTLKHWCYLVKIDSIGNHQWGKFLSDTNDLSERPVTLLKLTDTTAVVICNVSYSYSSATHDQTSLKAIKIDMNGNVLDSIRFGTGINSATDVILNDNGEIVVCGTHRSVNGHTGVIAIKMNQNLEIDSMLNISVNYDTLCPYTITDGFIPYDTLPVGIDEKTTSHNQIIISAIPNPFSEEVNLSVEIPHQNRAELLVCNTYGQIIVRCKLNGGINKTVFSQNEFQKGIYIAYVKDNSGHQNTIKLVKIN